MVSDPTEIWRAAMNDFAKSVDEAFNQLGPPPALGQSTSAQLRQTQAALHASQQDLTAMQAERGRPGRAQRRAEGRGHRDAQAGRALAHQAPGDAYDLAKANHRNRILTAENEAALRALNEKERHD
jgi:hypothetical protein